MNEEKIFNNATPVDIGEKKKEVSRVESESEKEASVHELYRGIWADKLENGQQIPVGGTIFRPDMHLKLILDFDAFDDDMKNVNPARLEEIYQSTGEENIMEYLDKLNSEIDPRLFYTCLQVQMKIGELLKTEEKGNRFERLKKYDEDNPPKLSELIGNTMCAERAALGQYVMQKLQVRSSYMSGINMLNPDDPDEFPGEHSFLVVEKDGKKYIFDIARPHRGDIPRIFDITADMSAFLFKDKNDLLVKGEDVLDKGIVWFGVGSSTAGKHSKF